MMANDPKSRSVGAWMSYAHAWANYLLKIGLFVGGIGFVLWYGHVQGGWIGVGIALALVLFALWIFQDGNFDRLLGAIGALVAFLFIAAVVGAGIIGFGYLIGIGIGMAK